MKRKSLMRKLAAVLVVVMAVNLTACGGTEDAAAGSSGTGNAETADSATQNAGTQSAGAESGGAEDTVYLR